MRERVWTRIALQRGEPVSQVKRSYPESDFRQLVAYLAHEPPIEDRLEWWSAQLLSAVANQWRGKNSRPVEAGKLIPDRWRDRRKIKAKKRTPGQWNEYLRNLCVAFGGKVVDRGGERGRTGHPD